ncbi:MAG: UDP-N-acetylmuramoyl-tripeptide--D-alanyl-D-alanine ligase [Candidatus Erwinia impunctatus]|nr:UDP-N-acetylmuramoyl-tripeptide--D-alanyl-D-alanine ligase [Culicoides impunctatus]
MISLSLLTLAQVTRGQLFGRDVVVDAVTTDTRKNQRGCLFVALKGAHFDAHDFAQAALDSGATALLVERKLPLPVPQVVVADTRQALGALAGWLRRQVNPRVVALTGSSGKTSVKEMTAAILRQCGETLFTAGNLNNDIGVPLTLLRLTREHQYAVIELGANHQGEIAYTVSLVGPEAALVNNLSAAHLEGFGSLAGVAQAKGEIFSGLKSQGIAIVNNDSHDPDYWQSALADKKVWYFSSEPQQGSDFFASGISVDVSGSRFLMTTPKGMVDIHLPLPGRHNIANALAASALALAVDAPLSAIQKGLAGISAVPGRLYPIQLSDGQLLLDDSYNANVGSMTAAIEVLAEMPGMRVFVVGDMAELGEDVDACHQQIGEIAAQAGIDKVLSIGQFSQLISAACQGGEHFTEKSSLIDRLLTLLSACPEITILVKGSRSAAMDEVVQYLQENKAC